MSDAEDLYPALQDRHPSLCSLDELEERYWRDVAPDLRDQGHDPETHRPTHQWLSTNGHRDLIYALREYHDQTFGEFWTDTLGLTPRDTGYNWRIDDGATIDALETYLDRREGSRWHPTTVDAHRSRLNTYAAAYHEVNGTDDLLAPIAPGSSTPTHEAKDACWRAFDHLDDDKKRSTLEKLYRAADQWYEHLVDRGLASTNPTTAVASNYDWSTDDTGDAQHVTARDVGELYAAATTNRDRTLVVALCAWGLRSGEVAALHRDQLHLDVDAPFVAFDERKNGPGTVAVVYGAHDAQVRVSRLRSREDWNGYLFPSQRSRTGHVSPNTVRRWFGELADRADVTVDGACPTPKMARKYWYDAFSDTLSDLLEHVEDAAEAQGSSSARVVWSDYLSEERRRELRREFMADRLAAAFDEADD